jgi:hypothetical protein
MQLRVGVRSHLASLSMRTMLCLVGSPGTLLRSTRQDKKLLGRHDTGQNHVYPNRTMVPKLLRAAHSDAAARELRAPCSLVGNRPPCSLLRFFGKRVVRTPRAGVEMLPGRAYGTTTGTGTGV